MPREWSRLTRHVSVFAILLVNLIGCKKDGVKPALATLETTFYTLTTPTSARVLGKISSEGGAPVTERGISWSSNPTPSAFDTKAMGTSIGPYNRLDSYRGTIWG